MISFVVLHYKTISETICCLESLSKTFNEKNYNVIVVDNNTLSDKEIVILKNYTDDIILLEENLGFAKANNIGCKYAIEKYNPDFIAVINNDVFINQKDFIDKIVNIYENTGFDMLGPYIDSPTGESCNPFPVICEKKQIEKEILKCKKLEKIYSSAFLTILLGLYIKIKRVFVKPVMHVNGDNQLIGSPLHGCAIIFSKNYYSKYDDIFYNDTFLFHEEEFIYLRVLKDKLISVYDPSIYVFHKEGSSIAKDNKKVRQAKKFKAIEKRKSLELLLKQL